MKGLATRGLSAAFGDRRVLSDIDLDLPRGEIHAVLGPSGCGKTTFLRCLAGLKEPTSGTVELEGEDLAGRPPERRGIVLMHQENALFPHLDVARNIAFGLAYHGTRTEKGSSVVQRMLALVGLPGYEKRRVNELSGGERQRVALARALAVQPAILLLDEPLSHLDARLRADLRAEIHRILKQAGATAYYVTHDREEAFAVADQIVLLADGRVVDQGPVERVFEAPATPEAARLLGRRNLVPFEQADGSGLRTPCGVVYAPDPAPAKGTLLLREEELRLEPHPQGPFIVEHLEYLGGRYAVRARSPEGAVWTEQASLAALTVGSAATLDLSRVRPRTWLDPGA